MLPRQRRRVGLPSVPRALRLLAGLDQDQFDGLNRAISGSDAFAYDHERASIADIGVTPDDITTVLLSLAFLYERASADAVASTDSTTALRDFLHLSGLWRSLGDSPDHVFDRLTRLLAPNPAADKQRKRGWLLYGILENAVSFASFVDLRPNFTIDRTSVEELLPVIIFRVTTETDDGHSYSYSFQLNEASLLQLKTVVEDTTKKLACIATDRLLASRVVFDAAVPTSEVTTDAASQ